MSKKVRPFVKSNAWIKDKIARKDHEAGKHTSYDEACPLCLEEIAKGEDSIADNAENFPFGGWHD